MIKIVLASVILLFANISLAQQNDSTCILTRWIELDSTAENAAFFTSDKDENNIIAVIKELTLNSKLDIYREDVKDVYYESDWIIIDSVEQIPFEDTLITRHKSDLFKSLYTTWDFLKDENGDPLMETKEDGTEGLAFSDPIEHPFDMRLLNSIRVREHLLFNEETMQDEFVVTGFALVADMGIYGTKEVVFWVSAFELNDLLKNKPHPAWLNALNNRNYKGFQYMQKPCNFGN